jgi:endonuclease III related protein
LGLQGTAHIRYTPDMRAKGLEVEKIRRIFRRLKAAMGPQHWWPAGSAFEVVVGAYLTQNTAWTNVEGAMVNLRRAGVLSISGVRDTTVEDLEQLVRPAGYFRQKAARVKLFVAHLDANYGGSLETMFARQTDALREELLGLPGIGPETADSILLYAANREVFVVDSYTRRIFERHRMVKPETGYEEIRLAVQKALTGEARVEGDLAVLEIVPHVPSAASQMERSDLAQGYNEFHALIVQTAKHFCMKGTPRCENCPLRAMLETEKVGSKANGKKLSLMPPKWG